MVSSEEETEVKAGDTMQWDVDMEIQLFYAMANHKPVGINKHFHMAGIWEKMSNSIAKEISTQDIWKHLESLYDLNLLEDTEPIPFPNHEVPFSLPESEFGSLMKQKCKEAILAEDSEGSRKDSVSALAAKTRKESGSSHASTDTPSIKSEKDYGKDRRRDSRDSNASGPRDSSSSRKSTSQREKVSKSRVSSVADEDNSSRRGRRRANTSTPPATTPAKRRRT
ncbi:MRG/MORF4L-binding protein isoform X3 [Trichoplusia ni]|uniref:MRG/MORF4L-binding protein isoform X3 n=1 Tax=Trichoplusia ni TaxID=7111 RepID=A0A7E5VIJ6_TRINI|nr:MRG/MORF4L-binding protein isoform X3 [Trichoplusia ni]